MISASDEKWRLFSCFFSVQGTGGSPTGPDPENRVGDQDIGSPGRPVSSGLQVPGEPGHCRARTRPPWGPSRGVFPPQKVLQLHHQRWVILCVDSLVLWHIINEEDAVLIPENRGENFTSGSQRNIRIWQVRWIKHFSLPFCPLNCSDRTAGLVQRVSL